MEKKKSVVLILAVIIFGTGCLSATMGAADKPKLGPEIIKIVKWFSFPGDGKVSYETDPANGCIQKFFYENGKPIEPKQPGWLLKERNTVDFGSFTDSQCREGVIGIGGSPIEYWGYANGSYYCIGAYDPECPAWYQPCRDQYPSCP